MTSGDFWNKVDAADKHNAHNGGMRGNQGSVESKAYNSGKQYNLISEEQIRNVEQSRYGSGNYNEPGSNLPDALRESFKKQPPIQFDDSVMAQIPDSFFAGASKNMQKEIQREQRQQPQRQQINENKYQQSQYQPQPQGFNTGVDYNYIKYMISEAVKDAMSNIPLNESANMGNIAAMKLVNGNTFQFMDSKGHIYEAKLKRIK